MNCPAALLCLLALLSACGEPQAPPPPSAGPSPAPPPTSPAPAPTPPAPSNAQQISVGEEVRGVLAFHGDSHVFELTAPSDGTLTATVGWDPQAGRVEVVLAGSRFTSSHGSITAKVSVAAGQKYRIEVDDGAPWDYDVLYLPFVLNTFIE